MAGRAAGVGCGDTRRSTPRVVRRTVGRSVRSSAYLAMAVLLVGGHACVSRSALETPFDPAGKPSVAGCDAWFEAGGTFAPARDEMTFTLRNTSMSPTCRATAVTIQFRSPVSQNDIAVTTPSGWTTTKHRCAGEDGVCGVTWRSTGGLGVGESVGGFRLTTGHHCLLKVWVAQVGSRRVGFPYGRVSG